MMNNEDKQKRTKAFALRIVKLYGSLPSTTVAQVLGKQLLRSGTSVGAHYREGYRARSTAEFISKLGGAQQELEESVYWMELLADAKVFPLKRFESLFKEADELMAIFSSSIITAKKRKRSG